MLLNIIIILLQLQPTKKPAQPVTVDTSKYKQKLLDVILTAVHSGHADPIENAVQVLKEHCEHPIGVLQLLDFVPQKNPPINVCLLNHTCMQMWLIILVLWVC